MTEIEKLRHMLKHWIEHNQEHVRTYEQWASKVESINRELAGILRRIAEENRKIDELFKKALEAIQKGEQEM